MRRVFGCVVVAGLLLTACNDSAVQRETNKAPVAEAGDNITVLINELVDFDASASFDEDGTIIQYDWDFGDGTTDVGLQTNHAWTAPGTYTVTLTVTDNEQATGTDAPEVTIEVEPFPGQYAVEANPSSQSCGGAGTTFVATNVDMIIADPSATCDWHWETITHPTGEPLLELVDPPGVQGQISADTFAMDWTYNQLNTAGGVDGYTDNDWTGTFNGDGTMTTTLIQNIYIDFMGTPVLLCQLTWNVTGTKTGELP